MQTNLAVPICRDSRDPDIGVRNCQQHSATDPHSSTIPALADRDSVPLEEIALSSEAVLDRHFNGKRIEAIKVLRELTVAGLLRSEEAICNLYNVPVARAAMTAILESRIGR